MKLNIKGLELNLNNSVQLSPKGRPFRLSSTESIGNEVWVDRVKKTGTRHIFRYLDVPNEFIGFEFDAYGVFVRKV